MRGGETLPDLLDAHVLLPFLEVLSEKCAEEGHALCSPSPPCFLLREQLRSQAAHDADARAYDIGLLSREWTGMPTVEWPVVALIGLVRRRLSQAPWVRDAFERHVQITSALARLGEHGIPADAIIRRCLRAPLRRALLTCLGTVLEAIAVGDLEASHLPPPYLQTGCR
jgi:hypothetical protein